MPGRPSVTMGPVAAPLKELAELNWGDYFNPCDTLRTTIPDQSTNVAPHAIQFHFVSSRELIRTGVRGHKNADVQKKAAEGLCHTHLVPKDAPDTCLRCSYPRGWRVAAPAANGET